ncbi:hypothetical protein MHB77_32375 [Paenibacillus sp. FSL K6-3166]|uniref:hypothetical protein n=1 Tax=unclassified Paenibacillus TaxID=185978 RepID=UPI000BA0AC27|nr:hypothetical protein [Paenibacillus sp. VTT E-133291]OZQ84699.1 hypothetical protein CA598_23180 [Paenibacillus sp. VTT E-133291]
MAEIIPFPNAVADALESLAKLARAGRITGVMFAATGPDEPAVLTGWQGVDLTERAVMLTHMQFDLIAGFIDENYGET